MVWDVLGVDEALTIEIEQGPFHDESQGHVMLRTQRLARQRQRALIERDIGLRLGQQRDERGIGCVALNQHSSRRLA